MNDIREFYDLRFSPNVAEFCQEMIGFIPNTKDLLSLSIHENKIYNQSIITLRYKDRIKTGSGYYSIAYKKGEDCAYRETY